MKKNNFFLRGLITLIFVISIAPSFSQIPNGDFANWAVDSIGRMDLTGWNTSNVMFSALGILQDTDRTGGIGYSAKLITVLDSTSNDYEMATMDLVHAPFSNSIRPSTISGFWKLYDPFITDGIALELWLYNSANAQIGHASAGTPFTGSIPNWTAFSDNISYTTNDPVTSYSIQIIFFNLANQPGIYCHIDDLTFDVSTSIQESKEEIKTKLLTLNNCQYRALVDLVKPSSLQWKLFDAYGKIIMHSSTGNDILHSVEIDLSNLSIGMYYWNFKNEEDDFTFRLVK